MYQKSTITIGYKNKHIKNNQHRIHPTPTRLNSNPTPTPTTIHPSQYQPKQTPTTEYPLFPSKQNSLKLIAMLYVCLRIKRTEIFC